MPISARMYISGIPYHVVQRGDNRDGFFLKLMIGFAFSY